MTGIATADMLAPSNIGRLLYEIVFILPYDGTNNIAGYVSKTYYYDRKGRMLQMVEYDTPTSTTSRYTNKYDAAGNVVTTIETHSDGTTTNTKRTDYTFDKFGRLLAEKTTVNTAAPVTVTYTYDELGNMASKTLGSSGVTETYEYNLQGVMTSQDSKRMRMDYTYDTAITGYGNQPRYDGNLSMVEWQYKTTSPKDEAYVYTYDKQGQLAQGEYFSAGTAAGIYDENVQYDANGNITRMLRTGSTVGSSTRYDYNYDGNKINSINYIDSSRTGTYSFSHDANGNMTNNPRRGWNYIYNHLNLLSHITDPGAGMMAYYMWLADGTKYGVHDVVSSATRIYKGSFTYAGTKEADVQSVSFSGGEFIASGTGAAKQFTPNYAITDQSGSPRVVVDSKGSTIVRNSYYPFGLTHYNYLYTEQLQKANRYHFNGKEKQTFSTLIDYHLLDYGARMYDPYLCRWTTPDPETQFTNPYIFSGNNPANLIDPDGKLITELVVGFIIGSVSNLLINGLSGNGPETGRELIGQIMTGGLAGMAGSYTFLSVMRALPVMNVFLSGAIAGSVTAIPSGFISGAGTALTYGASFGQALEAGIIGAVTGIPIGAVTGALGNALNAWLSGADMKTGKIILKSLENTPSDASTLYTREWYNDEYDFLLQEKIEENGFLPFKEFYNKSTTSATEGIRVVQTDGEHHMKFVDSNNKFVNGYVELGMYDTKGNIHISPYHVLYADPVDFKAAFGHELIHAMHVLNLGYNSLSPEQKKEFHKFTEIVAYKYVQNVYIHNGRFEDALKYLMQGISLGYLGTAPAQFAYPFDFPH